jgi:uncharacterized protein (TIGR02145 family)
MTMKHFLIMSTTAAVLSANAQVTLPYNPDGDANGQIGVGDIQDLLSVYGGSFVPGAILVDSLELTEVLDSLQSQITALQTNSGDAFRCGDDVLHEGYWYNTTSIGGQCWFSENVRYLTEVSPSNEGSETVAYAYVYGYEGSEVDMAKNTPNYHQFGVLYNFPAVQQWDLCPNEWHVPTDEEWTAMTSSLGSQDFAGIMMKSSFGDAWAGLNLSGFSGLPGGFRFGNGFFYEAGFTGLWWSSSPYGSGAWYRGLYDYGENVGRSGYAPQLGFSVRCVRDAE